MEVMEDDILNKFLEIGFKLHLKETKVMTENDGNFLKSGKNKNSTLCEYIYKPDYLNNYRYTLVTFHITKSMDTDYRLYMHYPDGKFFKSMFQITNTSWGRKYLNEKLNEIFKSELRENKIDLIINPHT